MLTFQELRAANVERFPQFRNNRGELVDCATWTPADWMTALTGEVGELANFLKKIRRGDAIDAEPDYIAKELADIQIYLDILAWRLDVNLGRATRQKFNEVSARVKCDVFL